MKVFINFGEVRCVVPVGDGSISVKQTVTLALERYRKATSKDPNSQIIVHTLKTCRDGAILDPDDTLHDVADDREQLIAMFEEPDSGGEGIRSGAYFNDSTTAMKTNQMSNISPRHHKSNSLHSYDPTRPSGGVGGENIYGRVIHHPGAIRHHPSQPASTNPFSINFGQISQHGRPGDSHSDSIINPLTFQNDPYQRDHMIGVVPHPQSKSDTQVTGPNNNRHQANGVSATPFMAAMLNNRRDSPLSKNSDDIKVVNSTSDTESGSVDCDDDDVIEITVDQINSYANIPLLHVRHGSEPNLNSFSSDELNHSTTNSSNKPKKNIAAVGDSRDCSPNIDDTERRSFMTKSNDLDHCSKRWSTAIAIDHHRGLPSGKSSLVANYEHSDEDKSFNSVSPQSTKEEGYGSEEQSNSHSESTQPPISPSGLQSPQLFQAFARGSGRLSMLNNNLEKWADAADRQLINLRTKQEPAGDAAGTTIGAGKLTRPQGKDAFFSKLCDSSLGSMSNSSQENEHNHRHCRHPKHDGDELKTDPLTVIIDLTKASGPLGIHVLPDTPDVSKLKHGLRVHRIEPGGRIDRDGRLSVGDIIIDVDNHSFAGINFDKAHEIFRSSLQKDQIKLLIIKASSSSATNCDNPDQQCRQLNDRPPSQTRTLSGSNEETPDDKQLLVEGEERAGQLAKMATVTSTKKHSPGVNLIGHKPATSAIIIANTRRIGKKYHIQLKKGEHGLGFTITTRDNPAGGLSPIYIKTILPRGAAVQDGRLKPGDRLLEVCGIEMTGKSQEEAVKILRNLPSDSIVDLIVSRQELEVSPSPLMPRQLPPEMANEPNCSSTKEREVLTFQIPLNDTGSAGLGISVKGKTSAGDGKQQDSGIFIKSVLHGGAASKDGRLKQDDQLININGIPLSGKTNSEAMETLTRATIKSANAITLTIARKICHSPSHCVDMENSYRHRHEASILSNESYDMSFNNNHQHTSNDVTSPRPYNDSQEDSFRSSENTVIYNASNKPALDRSKTLPSKSDLKQKSLSDSRSSSLNEEQDAAERFRRDGFGRQSMSEKRHAQLDAKTTDTYRRSKKGKDKDSQEPTPDKEIQTSTAGVYGEDEQVAIVDYRTQQPETEGQWNDGTTNKTPRKVKSPTKNQPIFSPICCWKCQSPGSCPCRSKSELSAELQNARLNGAGYQMETKVIPSTLAKDSTGSQFVVRRSCSLESLQTILQDLQKEQLGQVGGTPRAPTMARVGNKGQPNESFRAAVDRSYDIKNYIPNNMLTVNEEADDETVSRPSTCPYRVGGGHSMASTNFTTETSNTITTSADDNAQLLKTKKKKNLFKTLFNFSKKGRSKSMEPGANHKKNELSANDNVRLCSPNSSREFQLQDERLNMAYRKLLQESQQRQHQQQQQQPYPFVRNQLHSMHQSMPLSASYRAARSNVTQPSPNSQIYMSNSASPRDTVGVPQVKNDKNAYLRSHRIHPEPLFNEPEPNSQVRSHPAENAPRHMRINSQEFYGRSPLDRSVGRAPDNVNYGTYGAFPGTNHNGKMVNNLRHFGTASRTMSLEAEKAIHHYRQLSLRNPHQRQISSPASPPQEMYQSNRSRPISNFFDHEQSSTSMLRREVPPMNQQQRGYGPPPTRSYTISNYANKSDAVYGVVGQQHHRVNQVQSMNSTIPGPGNMIRQPPQQIYQSNQVSIYGTVYNPNASLPYAGTNPNHSFHNFSQNGLPNVYNQTK